MARSTVLAWAFACLARSTLAVAWEVDAPLALQSLLNDHADFADEAGVALTVLQGDQRFDGAAGFANRVSHSPMAHDSQFRVGSNTKMVLAIVAFQLIDEGQLSLDDPFGKYVSGYPRWNNIRLQDLLGMRSGITEYMRSPLIYAALTFAPKVPRTIHQILDFVKDEPLQFAPGQSCFYSNSNYLAVGLVIEAVTGKTIAEVVKERITLPLGLESTFMETGQEPLNRLVRGYLDVGLAAGIWGVTPALYTVFDKHERLGDGVVDATEHFHPSVAGPAGALISTTADMAKILRALMKGSLISPTSLSSMLEVQKCTLADQPIEYGEGIFRWSSSIGEIYGHGGLTFGYRSGTFYQPANDIIFSMMGNYYPDQLDPIADEMLRILIGEITPPLSRCQVNDSYFALDREDILNVRFRGEISMQGYRKPAIGMIKMRRNGRLYKLHTREFFVERDSNGMTVVTGLGTRQSSTQGLLRTKVYLSSDILSTPKKILATAEDISVDPTTKIIRKACISAVDDPLAWAQGALHVCDSQNNFVDKDQNFLRFFARIPMTSRKEAIAGAMAVLQRDSLCTCYDERGQTMQCDS